MSPQRIRLRRTKGYKKPEGAIVVARPSIYGNPFPVDGDWIMWTAVGFGWTGNPSGRRECSVALYRAWLMNRPVEYGPLMHSTEGGAIEFSDGTVRTFTEHCLGIARFGASISEPPTIPADRPPLDALRGHDLACWCPLDKPCHADVLLELANQ